MARWLTDRLATLVRQRPQRRVMLISGIAYWLLYLLAVRDLALHAGGQDWSARLAAEPWSLMWQARGPFQFEPVALLQAPFFTWTLSPVNAALGLLLAALVGANLALGWTAIYRPAYCSARPTTGVLAALPGLLAGSACCGPALLLVLGIPVTASLMGLFSLLIPISAALLAIALWVNLRRMNAATPQAP